MFGELLKLSEDFLGQYCLQRALEVRFDLRFEICGPNDIRYHLSMGCSGLFLEVSEKKIKKMNRPLLDLLASPEAKISSKCGQGGRGSKGETEVTTTELGTYDKSRSRYIRTWYILKIQKKLQQKLVHTSNPEVSTTEVGTYCKSRTNYNRSRYILQIQN